MKFGEKQFALTYQNQLDVIQGLKDKAWKAAYYSVLGQAAVFVLYRSVTSCSAAPSWGNKPSAITLSILISLWAFLLINNLQGGIRVRRKRAEFLRACELEERSFTEIWQEMDKFKPPCWCKRWGGDRPIFCAYLAAIIVPFVVVVGLVWGWTG